MIRAFVLSEIMSRAFWLFLSVFFLSACASLLDRGSREFSLAVSRMIVTDTIVTARKDAPWEAAYAFTKPVTSVRFPGAEQGFDRAQNWAVIMPGGASQALWSREDDFDVLTFDAPVTQVHFSVNFTKDTLASGRWGARRLEGGQFAVAENQFLAANAKVSASAKSTPRRLLQTIHFEPAEFGRVMAHGTLYEDRYTLDILEPADEYLIFGASNEGAIGTVQPFFSDDFPDWMREALSERLPDISHYFETRFGHIPQEKTTLIASITRADTVDPEASAEFRGAVRGEQIVYDMSGDLSYSPILAASYIWLITHESAHLWNAGGRYEPAAWRLDGTRPSSNHLRWLYEGGAEMLTLRALLDTRKGSFDFGQMIHMQYYVNAAAQGCLAAMTRGPLFAQMSEPGDKSAYECGLMIGLLSEAACLPDGRDSVDLWTDMFAALPAPAPGQTREYDRADYINQLRSCSGGAQAVAAINAMIDTKIDDPKAFLTESFTAQNIDILSPATGEINFGAPWVTLMRRGALDLAALPRQ